VNSRASIEKLLQLGKARLKLDLGIVSQIEDQVYTVRYCSSNPYGIRPGDVYELSTTYCSDVIKSSRTRYYDDVATISEMLKHPAYLNTQLRAYIGTPIRINSKIWGTLNYSSMQPRAQKYQDREVHMLEQQAQVISEILSLDKRVAQ